MAPASTRQPITSLRFPTVTRPMPLALAVKVSPTSGPDARLDATTRVLLHYDGHYQVLERSLRDFLHLERRVRAESDAATASHLSTTSIAHSIDALCNANQRVYPINQRPIRLSVAIETFLEQVVRRSALPATSRALKRFLGGNEWTSDETSARRYRDAVERGIGATGRDELVQVRVAAGCCVEHHETVEGARAETKRVVLWKFASEGAGVTFRAEFSRTVATESPATDPYSLSSNDVVEPERDEQDVVYYRTPCPFEADAPSFVYGHFVAETTGVVTLHWENVDKSSVLSKPLRFCVAVMPLCAAHDVLEAADACNTVDGAEGLLCHIRASNVTRIEDLVEWNDDECEDSAFGEDSVHDRNVGSGDPDLKSRLESAVLEERNHELEARVTRLEQRLAATKDELKSAVDRAQIAEEIYKANLETIAQLERATVSGSVPKSPKGAARSPAMPAAKPVDPVGAPMAQAVSSELERMQDLCAGFQEQCLWRSVENMELEAHLAASQVEASSWRTRHGAQAVQLQELEQQVATLRAHKKMLVHEVKRLQPFSHVNVAALVQEAQEARMVQRSLRATLATHERASSASGAKVLPSFSATAEMDEQEAAE